MDVINNIYNKLTQNRLGIGAFGRTWKYKKGDEKNKQELTKDEINSLCEKVLERNQRALEIYGHIYNVAEYYAVRRCSPTEDDEDDSDEEDAANFSNLQHSKKMAEKRGKMKKQREFATASVVNDQPGGRRLRRRKSRRKKKSRKSKRRKGLNSKKRRRRKRRTKKR